MGRVPGGGAGASEEEGLFRTAALAAFGRRHYGRPLAEMPRLWPVLGAMVMVMTAAAGAFLLTADYARKERVAGWLVPDRGLVRLTAGRHAQVASVAAREGDTVEAGDPLVVLSTDTGMRGGGRASDALIADLDRERAEAARQLSLLEEGGALARAATSQAIRDMTAERARLTAQLASQASRVAISADVLARFEGALADGAASVVEVAQRREAHAGQVQARQALRQRLATLDRQLGELEARSRAAPVETERSLSELRGRLAAIARQRTELARQGRDVLAAPVAGRVASLSAAPGDTAMPGETLVSLVPEGSVLYAQAYVPSRAIGFVEPGQRVRLMIQAFPHQRYGSAWGVVERVSATVLVPEEGPAAAGLDEPAYEARVRLDQQGMAAFGRTFPLRPGMAFEAEVIQERRTLAQLLLEPLRARREAVPEAPEPPGAAPAPTR